jgi:two-component system response regulator YesN
MIRKLINRLKHKQKRTVRFYKYFFSYVLVVVVLLLLISFFIYGSFIKILQEEVEASNVTALNQILYAVDLRLEELSNIALQISDNPKLTPFMAANGGFDSYAAIEELRKYRVSNAFIDNIVVYYGSKYEDRMYSADTSYSTKQFFEHFYKYDAWSLELFLQTFKTISEPLMRPVEHVRINEISSARLATYIYPLPVNADPYGVVLFQINEKSLRYIVQDVLKNYSGYSYILDEKSHPIFSLSSGDMGLDAQQFLRTLELDSLSGVVSMVRVAGKPFSLIRLSSEKNGWTYLIALPTERVLHKVQKSRNLFTYTAAAMLLLGLFMSFALATNHYRPLRLLVKALRKQTEDDPAPEYKDEIAYLSLAIGEVINEREGLMARLNSRIGLMKEQVLLALLKGQPVSQDRLQEMSDMFAVRLDKPYFVVMLFSIDDYKSFQLAQSPSMQDLYRFSIINVVEELAKEIGCGYAVDLIDNGRTALVLNLNAECRDVRLIRELAARAQHFFKQYYKFTLTVGISRTCGSISMISKSYMEARRASYYRFIKGKDQLIFYEDIKQVQESKYCYPAEQEELLVMAIRQGKGDEIERIVGSIIGDIIHQSLSPEAAQTVCFSIINSVMRTIDEMDVEWNEQFNGDVEHLLTRRFETLEILGTQVVQYCRQVCDYVSICKESRNFELRDKILAYVEANYSVQSLDLEGIAAHFQLSASYVTRFIKNQTGSSLIRYVDSLRMKEAKELLQSTDLPTKQIVTRVGYVDESNFLRKFKRNEGITPMQFRLLMKGKGLDSEPNRQSE